MKKKIIESLKNPKIREAVRIRSASKNPLIIIDGLKQLLLALEKGCTVRELFFIAGTDEEKEAERRFPSDFPGNAVSRAVFEKISYGNRTAGIIAVIDRPSAELSCIKTIAGGFYIALQGLEKPGNLGAVLRSADAAGAAAVIVCDTHTDIFNHNVVRSSMGAVFTVQLAETSSGEAFRWFRENNIEIYSARPGEGENYTAVDLRKPTAVVFGSEQNGVSGVWKETRPLKIPMLGKMDSINVAQTATLMAYEAFRQKNT